MTIARALAVLLRAESILAAAAPQQFSLRYLDAGRSTSRLTAVTADQSGNLFVIAAGFNLATDDICESRH
jgi:hypothetical protein